jgi:anti-sigma factor RsiW
MNKKIIELLYRSFDDRLSQAEQKILDQALSNSTELRAEKNRIAHMRTMIADSGQKSFQPFFAEKVMRRIRQAARAPESFVDSLIAVFRPVAIAATILFIALLSYNLFNSDHKSLAGAFAEPEIKLEHSLDPALALVME